MYLCSDVGEIMMWFYADKRVFKGTAEDWCSWFILDNWF